MPNVHRVSDDGYPCGMILFKGPAYAIWKALTDSLDMPHFLITFHPTTINISTVFAVYNVYVEPLKRRSHADWCP